MPPLCHLFTKIKNFIIYSFRTSQSFYKVNFIKFLYPNVSFCKQIEQVRIFYLKPWVINPSDFKTLTLVRSNIHSLKYQKSTTWECKGIWIKQFTLLTNVQFLFKNYFYKYTWIKGNARRIEPCLVSLSLLVRLWEEQPS